MSDFLTFLDNMGDEIRTRLQKVRGRGKSAKDGLNALNIERVRLEWAVKSWAAKIRTHGRRLFGRG